MLHNFVFETILLNAIQKHCCYFINITAPYPEGGKPRYLVPYECLRSGSSTNKK